MNDLIMEVPHLSSIIELKQFFVQHPAVTLTLKPGVDSYDWIKVQLDHYHYLSLKKKEKPVVLTLIQTVTGYSWEYCLKIVKKYRKGTLRKIPYLRKNAYRIYLPADITLLSETDILHKRMNASATKQILQTEAKIHLEYANLAQISVSHINNLRTRSEYKGLYLSGTKGTVVPIGETRKPEVNGLPGSIRIDTVHQRDIYYINLVDEITQWELILCAEGISEKFLLPLLEEALQWFPFPIFNFHSDRGSEYVNYQVAKILNKLLINQTKSRSRHCNDNALVESKNNIIRKEMGYGFIEKTAASDINLYLVNYFNDYLNFYRPCRFQTGTKESKKGRKYPIYGETQTPFNKLLELELQQQLQCFGQTLLKLEVKLEGFYRRIETKSPNDYARKMREEKNKLVTKMNQKFSGRTLDLENFTDFI